VKVSIVVPAYNEEENLPLLVPQIDRVWAGLDRERIRLVPEEKATDSSATP